MAADDDPAGQAGSPTVGQAVNGVVAGVSSLTGGPGARVFAVLVPPPMLREGSNAREVDAVDDANRLSLLR